MSEQEQPKKQKIAVVGSRTFSDKQRLYRILTQNKDRIEMIISGGATGADTFAAEWATDYGVPFLTCPAVWHDPETGLFDKGAGFRRNHLIVRYADKVLCFWDGVSKGTKHTMEIAEMLGKPVVVVMFSPPSSGSA